jgi:GAF domain-containing protein
MTAPCSYSAWRQRLLQVSLYAGLIIGFFVVSLGSYRAYLGERAVLVPFYLAAYVLLLLIALWEQVPYGVRAASFLGVAYSLGLLELIQFGLDGNGLFFMIALPILTVLFFGDFPSLFILLLSAATHTVFRWAISAGRFVPLDQRTAYAGQGGWWWVGAATFVLLASGLVILQHHLAPYLRDAMKRGRELEVELANYRARMEAQRRDYRESALQLELVVELARIAASRLDIDRVLRRAVQMIPDYLDCYLVGIFLLDDSGEGLALRAATGRIGAQLEERHLRLEIGDTSIVGWAANHRKTYVAPEVSADKLYRPYPGLAGTMSEVAVPLKSDGFLLGVLDVHAGSRDAFQDSDVRVLRGVADQLAMAVQNARRTRYETAFVETTNPLYRVNRRLSGATTVAEVVRVMTDTIAETEADGCLIASLEPWSDERCESLRYLGVWSKRKTPLRIQLQETERQYELRPDLELPLTEIPLPRVLIEQFWSVADATCDDGLPQNLRGMMEGFGARACVNVPIRVSGRSVGHMLAFCRKPGPFSNRSVRLFKRLGDASTVALSRARQLDEAQRRARREELAGKAAARMHESLDLETVLRTAAHDIGEMLGLAALDVRLGPSPTGFEKEKATGGNGARSRSGDRRGEEE